jgi:hypothetical protein
LWWRVDIKLLLLLLLLLFFFLVLYDCIEEEIRRSIGNGCDSSWPRHVTNASKAFHLLAHRINSNITRQRRDEARQCDAVRHALVALQESAIVQLLIELATGAWLRALYVDAGRCVPVSALDRLATPVCALLHRLFCEHPPLLALSIAHLADVDDRDDALTREQALLGNGDQPQQALLGNGGAMSSAEASRRRRFEAAVTQCAARHAMPLLCERVPSIHTAVCSNVNTRQNDVVS